MFVEDGGHGVVIAVDKLGERFGRMREKFRVANVRYEVVYVDGREAAIGTCSERWGWRKVNVERSENR